MNDNKIPTAWQSFNNGLQEIEMSGNNTHLRLMNEAALDGRVLRKAYDKFIEDTPIIENQTALSFLKYLLML